ncbi:unnamed protein product [Anisakis simplex]|uniref:C2H2-type domain-containing protein n=1 Tax=Anisakis simplex TaxID=6269 RepID=A0A0M3JV07_ANISI|nr:unnamed protein product [Anisakis simplex]
MIASLSGRLQLSNRLFEDLCGTSSGLDLSLSMDASAQQFERQQILLQQFYQQNALSTYLSLLNNSTQATDQLPHHQASSKCSSSSPIAVLPSCSSFSSPAQSPTSDPWLLFVTSPPSSSLSSTDNQLSLQNRPTPITISKPIPSYGHVISPQSSSTSHVQQKMNRSNQVSPSKSAFDDPLTTLQLISLQSDLFQRQQINNTQQQLNLLAAQYLLSNSELLSDEQCLSSALPSSPQAHNISNDLSKTLVHPLITQLPTTETLRLPTTPALPTPDATPSPSHESSSPQSTASKSSKEKEEDDEETLYVDVESIDDRTACKRQRKAHIEFYRKLKALRQRDKILECQLCHDKVENREHSLRNHVHSHSDTALFKCKLCGAESKEQNAMFAHIKQHHPNKGHNGFEDRRDMSNLSTILLKCFPKTAAKTRVGYNEVMDKISKNIENKSMNKVICAMCMKSVSAQKSCISRHAHTHPHFRCKRCKQTYAHEAEMVEHCTKSHDVIDPKITKDFNECSAVDVMLIVLKKCFPTLTSD